MDRLESQIAEWKAFVGRNAQIDGRDVDELDGHLRDQIEDLQTAGLAPEEAFLVAVQRIGRLDELTREFAIEHSGGLWRQLVVGDSDEPARAGRLPQMLTFAIAAAAVVQIAVQIARVAAESSNTEPMWLFRSSSVLVLPILAGFFARQRRLSLRQILLMAAPIVGLAVVVNLYPYAEEAFTEVLVILHLPVAMWFLVAYPYMGGLLESHERRMNFVRFTGEWFIYYVLIALGGGVLTALTVLILEPVGVDVEQLVLWVLPSGAAAGVIVAAWLVESKQSVIENMAPVLTMIFTPLFAVMLTASAVVYAFTGFGGEFDRELLGIFDALLVVVLGLVLYGMSARDSSPEPIWMDRIQVVAVVSALLLDAVVLVAMLARIGDLGFTPNRAAALGLNILLFVSLSGIAWLAMQFLRGRSTFHRLERWQTSYLTVFAAWAAIVVVVFPPLFAFK